MKKQMRYSPEVRERAAQLLHEHQKDHESQWAAILSIASKIGCSPETLRSWVRQSETDQGIRGGLSTSDRERLKELERENRELKRANEILQKALFYFAQAVFDHRQKQRWFSLISTGNGTGSSRSAGKFRLPHRVTMNIKRENEILTGYPIVSNETGRLSERYIEYGKVILKSMASTKYGGS